MMLRVRRRAVLALLVTAAGLGGPPGPGADRLHAQSATEPILGFGYVANAPQMLAGGAVWGIIPGLHGFGLYADFKTSLGPASGYDNFVDGLTLQEARATYGDQLFDAEDHWYGFNGAILRSVTPELILYAGGGVVWRTRYQELWDPSFERGDIGYYWVEDPEESGTFANLMGGGFLRIGSRVRIQFGGELKPAGFTVGLSLNQPAR